MRTTEECLRKAEQLEVRAAQGAWRSSAYLALAASWRQLGSRATIDLAFPLNPARTN